MIDKVINNWDPIELFPYAPSDEYEEEIRLIEKFVSQKDINIEMLADEIQRVFTKRFGSDVFKQSKVECYKIAKIIMEQLAS